MPLHEDVAALLYTAIWPLTLDGRFKEASRGQRFTILFHFKDWPPAVLLKVNDGQFSLDTGDPAALAAQTPDARVEGRFDDVVKALEGFGAILKLLLLRKVKMHNKRVLLRLGRILLSKKVPHPGGEAAR